MSARNIVPELGNENVDFHNVAKNVGNGSTRASRRQRQ